MEKINNNQKSQYTFENYNKMFEELKKSGYPDSWYEIVTEAGWKNGQPLGLMCINLNSLNF
jgi:hypothetical protein